MNWLEPYVVHGAHLVPEQTLRDAGRQLRARLDEWRARNPVAQGDDR